LIEVISKMNNAFKIGAIILSIFLIHSCKKNEVPTISTSKIIDITETSAVSGGNVTDEGSGPVLSRGICWNTIPNPTIDNSKTSDGIGPGTFTSNLTNLSINTPYYLKAYAINRIGISYGNEISCATRGATGTATDTEGIIYSTIQIGTQVWMSENLKTIKYSDGTILPNVTDDYTWVTLSTPGYCWYNNDEDTFKAIYGALYNWYSVDPVSNNGKNICPAGWHVPTDVEWTTLENYLITNGYNYDGTTSGNKIAKSMAAKSGWAGYEIPGTVGNDQASNNSSGFTALPGGFRFTEGNYTWIGNNGGWWSMMESSSKHAYNRIVDFSLSALMRGSSWKFDGFSVRCVKD